MKIGTAEADSTFLAQGRALADLLRNRGVSDPIEAVQSNSASIDNANRLHAGEIDFGFMAANWIGRAKEGSSPFKQPIDLRMVAPMNAGPLFFITRADSAIRTISDLKGKRVCPGLETSGMNQHGHTIFGALGWSYDDFDIVHLDFARGAEALSRGEIDAQLQCPIPNKIMTDADARDELRVVVYEPAQLKAVLDKVPFYRRAILGEGQLRALKQDVPQPGVVNVLVTHARTDPQLVRQVTRAITMGMDDLMKACALYDRMEDLFEPLRFNGAQALEFGGVKLHDGALAAYREADYIGDDNENE